MLTRALAQSPDWWTLCASFARQPGAVALWSSDPDGTQYVACDPSRVSHELDPEPELPLAPAPDEHGRVPRWIGILPYEAFRSVERSGWSRRPDARPEPHVTHPVWHRYDALVAQRGERTWLLAESPAGLDRLERHVLNGAGRSVALGRVRALPTEPLEAHGARIERAIELMRAGDLYQVNLSRRLEFEVQGDAFALLRALLLKAPARYCMAWNGDVGVAATSPELLLELDPTGILKTGPIKGTRARGRDAIDDAAQVRALSADPKERAELTMVVDVERNDLSRVARVGSVRVPSPPEVTVHPTLLHRQVLVTAELRAGVSRSTLLRSMLPSGSVTGAPKSRAMEVIAELEAVRRGLYTGGFGVLRRNGGMELAMAIRLATLRAGVGHFHVGGGIVVGSHVQRELAETALKATQLLSLFPHAD